MVRKLSVLVPVYNEIATVERLMRRLMDVRFPIEREIIAVDDGSSDGSGRVLERLADKGLIRLFVHPENRGKGAAVQTAARHASGDVLVIQDADLELDPGELPVLLKPIRSGETQVCYGSRFLGGVPWSVRWRPAYWANVILNKLSNLLNDIRITDFNTCYKMMTAEVMSRLSLTQRGFAIEPEITAKIARLGYTILERPVRYDPRSTWAGKKIRLVDTIRCLRVMVRYRRLWPRRRTGARELGVSRPVSRPVAELRAPGGVQGDGAEPRVTASRR